MEPDDWRTEEDIVHVYGLKNPSNPHEILKALTYIESEMRTWRPSISRRCINHLRDFMSCYDIVGASNHDYIESHVIIKFSDLVEEKLYDTNPENFRNRFSSAIHVARVTIERILEKHATDSQ